MLGSLRTPPTRKYLSSDLKEVREQAMQISGEAAFGSERPAASAKVLRWVKFARFQEQ